MSKEREHILDKVSYHVDVTNSSIGLFFIVFVVVGMAIFWVLQLFGCVPQREDKPLIKIEKIESDRTLSHKLGEGTRKSSAEFLRGFFGFKSKKDEYEKNKNQKDSE